MNVINHIEDEIPEYELLKMLKEVEEEGQEEILDIAKEQNRVAHHMGKTYKPKKSKKEVAPVCYKAPLDKTICKMCYRKFMDTNPLASAVFTDADFKIECETLC